jgi:hypothetical protein
LARHSTVQLTLGRYAHAGLFDLTAAVIALPCLSGGPESAAFAAAGIDGAEKALAQTLARDGPI